MFSLATSCARVPPRPIAEQSCGNAHTQDDKGGKNVGLYTKAYNWEKQTNQPTTPPVPQPLASRLLCSIPLSRRQCAANAAALHPSSASAAVTHMHTARYCSRGEKAINVSPPPLIYNISVCWTCPVSVVLCLLHPRVHPHAFTQTPTHAQSM